MGTGMTPRQTDALHLERAEAEEAADKAPERARAPQGDWVSLD